MHSHHHDEHAGSQQTHPAEAPDQQDRYDEPFWEERYRSQPAIWSGRPNPALVAEITDIPAGTALDIGCGEGGDAIWLAQRGWTITAVDFATAALERGAARAADLGLDDRIRWVHADLTGWQPAEAYDLVNCQYLHLLREEQEDLAARLAKAVAPGGTLLYVSHAFEEQFVQEHPQLRNRFLSAEQLAALLRTQEWDVLVAGNRRRPDAGEHPAGHAYDSVLKAVRSGTRALTGSH